MVTRRNQSALTPAQQQAFISAATAIHAVNVPQPRYLDFISVHMAAMDMSNSVGMSWGVHTMNRGMPGRNFLAWHRQYLLQLERRLQKVDASVSLPYWDWMTDRVIPAWINTPAVLTTFGVTRNFQPQHMPQPQEMAAVEAQTKFTSFQRILEMSAHGDVHNAIGGTMASSASPSDPLFWLHHANIDRLWADWAGRNRGAGTTPPNGAETLQPAQWNGAPLFGVKVSSVVDIATLGYTYA